MAVTGLSEGALLLAFAVPPAPGAPKLSLFLLS